MTLDPADPTRVTSFGVFLDGDAGDDIRNPESIDADDSTVMIQEDLREYNREEDTEDTARILAYDIASSAVTPLARVDQSEDPDRLVETDDEARSWASSGLVDVSDLFGPGTWLVTVQARTLEVPQSDGVDEGGQLLLLRRLTLEDEPVVAPTATTALVGPTATTEPVVPTATTEPVVPTAEPTAEPTAVPTIEPTAVPTIEPALEPTEEPTVAPTAKGEVDDEDVDD